MRGDGRIYQRGPVWWVEYWHHGKQVRESAKTTDEATARKVLRKRSKLANTPHFVAPTVERVTFGDLAAAYLTDYEVNGRRSIGDARRNVQTLGGVFGMDRAADITAERIETYKVQRLADGLRPASVNRELAALRRMFTLAVRTGRLPVRPHIALLAEENAREGFLEPADFEALCQHLPAYVQDAARFAYLIAWRRGAVRGLEWRDVNLEAGTIRLRASQAKNKRALDLPLRGELRTILERRAEDRRPACPFVFHRDGKRLGDYRKVWRKACAAVGLGGILVHDLRRSAARNAVRAGVPEQVVMALGGWRTRSVFARYNVTSDKDLGQALDRVTGYVEKRRAEKPKVRPLRTRTEPAQTDTGGVGEEPGQLVSG